MTSQPFLLNFQPGVQRDGTKFDATRYLAGLWCRFRLGRPRKIGGYTMITGQLAGLPRLIHGFYQGAYIYWHIGTVVGIQQVITDTQGNFVGIADRTPTTGFLGSPSTGWTLDALFDTTSNVVQLIAHAVPDQNYLASAVKTVPFLGDITAQTPLAQFSNPNLPSSISPPSEWIQPSVAGGICCVQPFVFAFDSAGLVLWSAPNLALYLGVTGGATGAGQARISAQKIVAGIALRGGGVQQPAALFWSLSEVIVASYVGTPAWFAFSTVSTSSSIISGESVCEYDGLYFWCGVDRFLVFNGTVSEVPNPVNQDFWFDNMTLGQENQTYAFKVPRYGEIWWCGCLFGSTVPNWAVIYNLRENTWYDTPLPDGGRSSGFHAQGSRFPVMTDVVKGGEGYGFWLHEKGTDKVVAGQVGNILTAVQSYYETGWFGGPLNTPPDNRGLQFAQFEPDIDQAGPLNVNLIGAANSRAPEVQGPVTTLPQVPTVPQEQMIGFTPTMPTRLLRLHVESNVIGGSYIVGREIGHGAPSEPRKIS